MGTVIHREEFTNLLLDFATGTEARKILFLAASQ
jgi:hypothetical protein